MAAIARYKTMSTERPEGRQRRFRFSLRTLLLVFVAAELALSLFYYVFLREMKRPLRSAEWQLVAKFPGAALVTELCFSPDWSTLISGHVNGSLRWWDVASGKLLRTIQLDSGDYVMGGVDSIAFSPNGKLVSATARGERTLRIWKVATGKVACAIRCSDILSSVCFSPAGDRIAACEGSSKLRLWDTDRFELQRTFKFCPTFFPGVCFAPSGRSVVLLTCTSLFLHLKVLIKW